MGEKNFCLPSNLLKLPWGQNTGGKLFYKLREFMRELLFLQFLLW